MKINAQNNLGFKRKPRDMADYYDTLKKAQVKAGNRGKSILIVPTSNLPQSELCNTGVGTLGSKDGLKFFEFVKKLWGINEIQILPCGQYHFHNDHVPMYSGTSMDLGNHMIDIESHATEQELKEIVLKNTAPNTINYKNIISYRSIQNEILEKIYDRADKTEFERFKAKNSSWLESKSIFQALREINGTHNYKHWPEADKNLYKLDEAVRNKRIAEIYKQKEKFIDFYKFKQYLADNDLQKAKEKLNSNGLKLNGDLLCGFSYDEVWANPKAFIEGESIGWGLPALDLDSKEGEKLLREKVNLYAKRFDGFRVDAAWTYANQPLRQGSKYYGDKFLNIIDDEVKKVKGVDYDLKNIMYEFIASTDQFNMFDGNRLKPYVDKRNKIFTSDHLSCAWGSNKSFLERGWNPKNFIIGVSNHDSPEIKVKKEQADALSSILKIPKEKLMDSKEFMKAKFAEPMSAFNNMVFFREALGMQDWKDKIPADYEKQYFEKLERGEGFNPMDALEKSFVAQGLDKKEPKLFKKIVKYRKILEGAKEPKTSPVLKWGAIALGTGVLIYGLVKYCQHIKSKEQ